MIVSVIGIDPGPATGMAFLEYHSLPDGSYALVRPVLIQAPADSAVHVLEAMLRTWYPTDGPTQVLVRHAAVERFITGRSAGTTGGNAEVTRQLVMTLAECCQLAGYKVHLRSAADAKTWATDKRLTAAGIAKPGDGIHGKLRDCYDASRHALWAAVNFARMKDPLA